MSTVLASTTPSGLPKFPAESVNTRNTVTSKPIGRPYGVAVGSWSGGAALVGTHGLQPCPSGIDRSGAGLRAAAAAEQLAQGGLSYSAGSVVSMKRWTTSM